MDKKKTTKIAKIFCGNFMEVNCYNYLMPTRYSVDNLLDKTVIKKNVFRDPAIKHRFGGKQDQI